jgi:uncharacterized protein (DUF2147 family)
MKNLILLSFLIACSARCFSQTPVSADDITGTWISHLEKGHVEITRDGDKYSGKIVWLKVPLYPDGTPKIDKNNPDKTKRNQPLVGLVVLKDLVFVKDHWENGSIYDPESGKTYSCRIIKKDNKLDLRGYIGVSQIGRTQTWVLLTDNQPKQ